MQSSWRDSQVGRIKNRLKIAVLVRRFITTGGMERYVVEVTRRLARQHDVHVFCQERSWDGDEDITFHRIPKFFTRPSVLNLLVFSHYTGKYLDESFDIVHSHERVTHFNTLTVHCPCFRTFITDQEIRWRRLILWISVAMSPRKMAYLWLEKRQFSDNGKRIWIAVSEKVRKNVQENYNLPDKAFGLAYPGVDIELMKKGYDEENRENKRSGLGIDKDDLVILFVGTEFKRKGLDALLEGFSLIARNDTKLLIAGGGDQKGYLRAARRLGIENRVIFLGLVEDIENVYAISDVYILPTLSEPAGMSPMEAMAAGLPTVLSSPEYAGSSELIKNGEAMILKSPDRPREIAEALSRLMDKDLREDLGSRGQRLARELTWERTTEDTLSVYKRILQSRREGLNTREET